MPELHILIAHNLHTYASALAGALTHLRPQFHVQLVRAEELRDEMARFPDAFVISDEIARADERAKTGWILYYPGLQNFATVRIGQSERTVIEPDLDDLIDAVDQAARNHAVRHGDGSGMASQPCLAGTAEAALDS